MYYAGRVVTLVRADVDSMYRVSVGLVLTWTECRLDCLHSTRRCRRIIERGLQRPSLAGTAPPPPSRRRPLSVVRESMALSTSSRPSLVGLFVAVIGAFIIARCTRYSVPQTRARCARTLFTTCKGPDSRNILSINLGKT